VPSDPSKPGRDPARSEAQPSEVTSKPGRDPARSEAQPSEV